MEVNIMMMKYGSSVTRHDRVVKPNQGAKDIILWYDVLAGLGEMGIFNQC